MIVTELGIWRNSSVPYLPSALVYIKPKHRSEIGCIDLLRVNTIEQRVISYGF